MFCSSIAVPLRAATETPSTPTTPLSTPGQRASSNQTKHHDCPYSTISRVSDRRHAHTTTAPIAATRTPFCPLPILGLRINCITLFRHYAPLHVKAVTRLLVSTAISPLFLDDKYAADYMYLPGESDGDDYSCNLQRSDVCCHIEDRQGVSHW